MSCYQLFIWLDQSILENIGSRLAHFYHLGPIFPTTALRLKSSIKYSTINNQNILSWFIEEILMESFIWCLVLQKYFRLFFDLIQGRGALHTTTNFEGNKFNLVTFLYTYLDRICHYSRILYSTIIVFYDPQRKYLWTSYKSPNYLFNCYNFVMVIW